MPFIQKSSDTLIEHDPSDDEFNDDGSRYPAISALADGGYVLTYTEFLDDYNYPDVYARIYDASGSFVRSVYVHGYANDVPISQVTGLPNGNFVVAWAADGPNGNGNEVYASLFSAAGTRLADVQVNTNIAQTQNLAGIRETGGGAYDIYWTDYAGLWVQHYDSNGAPVGGQTIASAMPAAPEQRSVLDDGTSLVLVGGDIVHEDSAGNPTGEVFHHAASSAVILARPDGTFVEVVQIGRSLFTHSLSYSDDGALEGGTGTAIGSESADTISASTGTISLSGMGGDDTLSVTRTGHVEAALDGGEGADTLSAVSGAGDHFTLAGGAGDDRITSSGAGSVTISGGAGADIIAVAGTAQVNGGDGDDVVQVTAAGATLGIVGSVGHDVIGFAAGALPAAIDFTDFAAGAAGDVLDFAALLEGYGWDGTSNPFDDGYVRLVQDGGNAYVQIDTDAAGGGAAFQNLLHFLGDASSLTADNFGGWTPNALPPLVGDINGDDGDNTLTGTTAGETITGQGGDDVIYGAGGADTIFGGGGDDTLMAGIGNLNFPGKSYYDGGEGMDVADFGNAPRAVNIDLAAGTGAGGTYANVYRDIEEFRLSKYDDTFYGTSGDDYVDGAAGADWMAGRAGNDVYVVSDAGDGVHEAADEGIDKVRSAVVTYVLPENVEDLLLVGAAVTGYGNGLANTITGNEKNNLIDGGGGADVMRGGLGDDTYYVDNVGDKVVEYDSQGTDLVYAGATYSAAGQYVENITLTGTGNINATGNGLANVFHDNAGINRLTGGAGDDTYYVSNAGDLAVEQDGGGYDTVFSAATYSLVGQYVEALTLTGTTAIDATGNSLNNVLTGNDAANVLNGGTGADRMVGGQGNDTYYVDNAGDLAVEGTTGNSGHDLVYATVTYSLANQYVEDLILTGSGAINGAGNSLANAITGNTGANTLSGGAGDDVLDGGKGADTLKGGTGDDVFYVDNAGDKVVENYDEGQDSVFSSVSFSLASQYIEDLTLTGTANSNATGNGLANVLTGNAKNNVLDGGAGADEMHGGAGDDIYIVDNVGDHVFEDDGQGNDTVYSSVDFSMAGKYVEALILTGAGNLKGTGNSFANTMIGNSGANSLNGGAGDDQIHGGLGNDTMTGGAGADSFWFDTALGSANIDTLADFTHSEDRIELSHAIFAALAVGTLSAEAFYAGAAAHDASDRIVYDSATGNLYYDADGNGSGAAVRFAHLAAGTGLTASDFHIF